MNRLMHRMALFALVCGALAVGLSTFSVVALLSAIAADFQISASDTGALITVHAFSYAVFAPLSAWALGAWRPRNLLFLGMVALCLGNLLCSIGQGYHVLLLGRVVAALGAGIFTPAASALATVLVPESRRGFALSLIFAGLTVAQALGIPLIAMVADVSSWRAGFSLVACMGLATVVVMMFTLVDIRTSESKGPLLKISEFGKPQIAFIFAVTFFVVASEYVVYSFVSVILADTMIGNAPVLASVLLAFGIGAFIGNAATGTLTDRLGSVPILAAAILFQTVLMLALVIVRRDALLVIAIGFAWGIISYSYMVPIQHYLLANSRSKATVALALNSSITHGAIGIGAWFGGLALAWQGVLGLAVTASVLGTAGLALTCGLSPTVRSRNPRESAETSDANEGRMSPSND